MYRAWQQYERAKASQRGWDRADLAAHLYRQLVTPGAYRGDFFDAIYRDEVQDFTQVGWGLDVRRHNAAALDLHIAASAAAGVRCCASWRATATCRRSRLCPLRH